jgi:serine/threonine protein kinase/Tol biopolymer transport system component
MNLAAGTTLAHYRITAALGAGGMGEVWRAEDTKLGREVALKVLPVDFASDPQRLARFEREAKVLASLNHPNIATLYGLETAPVIPSPPPVIPSERSESRDPLKSESDPGTRPAPENSGGPSTHGAGAPLAQDDRRAVTFLAMELVEGEDLSERIRRGPVPVGEAVAIALQVAEALEAAHETGIVHRDLKPANIKITDDGVVKVLDFGLAKAWESNGGESSLSMSPTMTAHATAAGVILGTAAYMAPEQARGKKVDRRADIWSFGVVLWEMLTGEVLFSGETATDVLAAVVRQEIDLDQLPRAIPVGVRDLIDRCLDREPKTRLRDMGEARIALTKQPRAKDASPHPESGSKLMTRRSFAVASAMTGAGFALGVGLGRRFLKPHAVDVNEVMLEITRLTGSGNVISAAISPDGHYIAFVQMDRGLQSLWLRQISSGQTLRLIPEGQFFFWGHTFSPDGNDVVFGLKTPGDTAGGIYAVSALGGSRRKLIDSADSAPAFSNDGKWMAYLRADYPSPEESALMVAGADGSDAKALAVFEWPDFVAPNFYSGPAWAPDGNSIVTAVGRRDSPTSDAKAWLASVAVTDGSVSVFSDPGWVQAAQSGYLPGGEGLLAIARAPHQQTAQIWYVDAASAQASPITNDLDDHRIISLSGDGKSLVSITGDVTSAIWVGPRDGSEPLRRRTWGRADGIRGICFASDGRIVYTTHDRGAWEVWTMTPDGSERVPLLAAKPGETILDLAVTGSGDVFFLVRTRSGGSEIRVAGADGAAPRVVLSGVVNDSIDVSRNGTLVYSAYVSSEHRLFRLDPDSTEPMPVTDFEAIFPTIDPSGQRVAFLYTDDADTYRAGIVSTAEGRLVWNAEVATPSVFSQLSLREEGLYLTNVPGDRANVWLMPLDGLEPRQLTAFDDQRMWDFAVSADGEKLAVARGRRDRDAVLIKNFGGPTTGYPE